jgi:hypothetical protein
MHKRQSEFMSRTGIQPSGGVGGVKLRSGADGLGGKGLGLKKVREKWAKTPGRAGGAKVRGKGVDKKAGAEQPRRASAAQLLRKTAVEMKRYAERRAREMKTRQRLRTPRARPYRRSKG